MSARSDGSWQNPVRPVAEQLASGGGDPIETAIGKVKLLQTLGLPAAHGSLLIGKADNQKPTIWILKCKPSCWRLYFRTLNESETAKRILYLHAKCKKKNRQDAKDSEHARSILEAVDAGGMRIAKFVFPPD